MQCRQAPAGSGVGDQSAINRHALQPGALCGHGVSEHECGDTACACTGRHVEYADRVPGDRDAFDARLERFYEQREAVLGAPKVLLCMAP